jgi:hypothetical protein
MSLYTNATKEDLKYSGPNVWPRLTADEQVDLFIFGRPELGYMSAIRKIESSGIKPNQIRVTAYRFRYEGKKLASTGTRRSFWHDIEDDKEEDVRSFLRKLRNSLSSIMPREPSLDSVVKICFYREDSGECVGNLQGRWV